MGLDLSRVDFDEWLHEQTKTRHEEEAILEEFQRHSGQSLEPGHWVVKNDDSVRVGSYGSFDVFRRCLMWLAIGEWLEDEEDYEPDQYDKLAQQAIIERVRAGVGLPRVEHFLDVGDSDTLYIPLDFDPPFEYNERWIASLPGAQVCLVAFAHVMEFDLDTPDDPEVIDGSWQPLATARNIARILFRFFREEPESCVAFT